MERHKDDSRSRHGRIETATFVVGAVEAGFPSPADDYLEIPLDLNELLILHPAATFFVRARGRSMEKAGISHGDLLVVDRSLEPRPGDCVIAVIDGSFTVKRFLKRGSGYCLAPANDGYPTIPLTEESDIEIWGVATCVIRQLR
ncbi:MAG: LexA family transcriptional regulator [Candidatus Zixiibacteriota bacterium]|nr:MAG: LexA family transcriptional regulator [candidate division Zixibacteria bacterium]